MCKSIIIMIMLAVMVTVGGCQSSKGFCEDIAGIATWSADKLEGLAEKAAERDADLAAKRLAERQAILDARIRMANANEVR